MSDIGPRLRIKYKLRTAPSTSEADRWVRLVEEMIHHGVSAEVAGAKAAAQLFEMDDNLFLKSEADTIESLLRLAGQK